jgi:hypothetical protein
MGGFCSTRRRGAQHVVAKDIESLDGSQQQGAFGSGLQQKESCVFCGIAAGSAPAAVVFQVGPCVLRLHHPLCVETFAALSVGRTGRIDCSCTCARCVLSRLLSTSRLPRSTAARTLNNPLSGKASAPS